jgi:hypothetical protein
VQSHMTCQKFDVFHRTHKEEQVIIFSSSFLYGSTYNEDRSNFDKSCDHATRLHGHFN